jgi:hypothetical protein
LWKGRGRFIKTLVYMLRDRSATLRRVENVYI